MASTRIYNVALEADRSSVDVLRVLGELGHAPASHMASISDELKKNILDRLKAEEAARPKVEEVGPPRKLAVPRPKKPIAAKPRRHDGEAQPPSRPEVVSRLAKADRSGEGDAPRSDDAGGALEAQESHVEEPPLYDDVAAVASVGHEGGDAAVAPPPSTVVTPAIVVPPPAVRDAVAAKPPVRDTVETVRLADRPTVPMVPVNNPSQGAAPSTSPSRSGSIPAVVAPGGVKPKTPPSSVAAAAEAARAATAHTIVGRIQLPPPRPPRPAQAPRPPQRPMGRPAPPIARVRHQPTSAPAPPSAPAEPPPLKGKVHLSEGVTVKEIAEKLEIKAKEVMRKLLERRIMATINTTLDNEIAKQVARDFGYEAEMLSFEEDVKRTHEIATIGDLGIPEDQGEGRKVARPPVVTVMGHVDHGKTSLLDAIRLTKVTESEFGGITQHIGAYHVDVGKKRVVFLDTPGHEAFTMMRARGGRAADIVILVVAADDGVMPQTIEAIHHAREAKVPIMVAINKVDKPGANLDRVKQQLADHGLNPEDWGGDTVMVPVSAKQKTNIDGLLEMVLLVAELQDLQADPTRPGSGSILEAELDKQKGTVATVLVQAGTLKVGDAFIAGAFSGKVRAMFDDRGAGVESVGPSSAVEVLGFSGLPNPGDLFQVVDEARARQVSLLRQEKLREQTLQKSSRLSLDSLHAQVAAGEVKELPIILKADVQGSVEVLSDSLAKLSDEKVKVKIIHSQAGAISVSDVLLASASNAIIFGFNVRPERKAQELAEKDGVDVRFHTVIYEIVDELKAALTGLLDPVKKETWLGRAEVRETFKIPKVGLIAGCFVSEGKILRTAEARLLRDNVVVWTGKLASLRRFKDDASEVKNGLECGIGLANFNDVKVGDVIEAFMTEMIQPKKA